jgi:hypothetical protein
MTTAARQYSQKTIKLLFGSSGNQCAEPSCTNPIIVSSTEDSEAVVVGQICHIYAAADNGPRGKPGLTDEDRNALDNLILLCGHHHPLVDKQWETFTAETLKGWKKAHEAKYQKETAEAAKLQASIQQMAFFQTYSDQQINEEVDKIRKGRFLNGFSAKEATLVLATRVDAAELAGGSNEIRAKAIAWCARILSQGDTAPRAQALLERSKALSATDEARLAEAFIISATDKDRALAMLAAMNTPASRSAALRVVTNHEKAKGAVAWVERVDLKINDFDAEGKLIHLMNELEVGDWQHAFATASEISDDDFESTPVLYHAVALAVLFQAVPEELRASLLIQAPFEADRFPLASDAAALAARRRAMVLFSKISDFARSIGAVASSNTSADYALWLKLRDPRDRPDGIDELRSSMRDSGQSLRRLNLALQFGIKLDLTSIEREIDRRIALSGKGTADEAFARFSLAFAQSDARGVAEYIAKHRAQLYEHLQKFSIQTIEIEMLARAGSMAMANEMLSKAAADGLGDREQHHLRRIIAEFEGADPAFERKRLFEESGDLHDLVNLTNFLEGRGSWEELQPFAEQLFSRTRSLEDGFRLARTLNEAAQYTKLFDFLLDHQELVTQSIGLKTLWAWSLYREGRFGEASIILRELAASRDDANDRALRVNIAIASGDWDDLIDHSRSEWENREKRSAAELLAAAHLAQVVNGLHTKDLVTAAIEQSPDDPAILAGAYFHATNAGWEQSQTISRWLTRAAELSGESGPLKSISMQELLDRKPEWDKQETSVWRQLNEGVIPTFGAAHLLHRSLIDFVLLQSLVNLSEPDPRRRSIVYAFSGARPAYLLARFDTIGVDLAAIVTLTRLALLETVITTYKKVMIPHSTLSWLFQERQTATFHQPSRIRDAHFIKRLVATGALKVLMDRPMRDYPLAKDVGIDLADLLATAKSKSQKGDGIPRLVVRSAPVHRIGSLMAEEVDLSAYADCICSCQAVVSKLRMMGALTIGDEESARSYFKVHERSWPTEPAIPDGAELYLDNLSVSYFMTVGILDKLRAAGLTAYITESEDADANRLITLESLTSCQLEIIEAIRCILAEGIKFGRVLAVNTFSSDHKELLDMHPTVGVLGINGGVDAFVVDDRFVNQHLHMIIEERQIPILSSLDVLDDLARRSVIARDKLFAHRTYLRQAGFQLIPVTEDELSYQLDKAPLADDAVVETAELRAIRESILKARMAKMLQIPGEAPWLLGSMSAIVRNIRRLWQVKLNRQEAAAYAQWLINLLDVRGFAASAIPGNERGFAFYAQAAQVLQAMTPPTDVSSEVRDSYFEWIDDAIVIEMKETQPEVFAWLVERSRELIAHSVRSAIAKLEV